jgi:hypothetical protein
VNVRVPFSAVSNGSKRSGIRGRVTDGPGETGARAAMGLAASAGRSDVGAAARCPTDDAATEIRAMEEAR